MRLSILQASLTLHSAFTIFVKKRLKMRFLFCFLFVCIFSSFSSFADEQGDVMYRLILTDKGHSGFSKDNPEEFLSKKSIERRFKQGLNIDDTDLPIDTSYFRILTNIGVEIRTYSKWTNTIVVSFSDMELGNNLINLPFVKDTIRVWQGNLSKWDNLSLKDMPDSNKNISEENIYFQTSTPLLDESLYGEGLIQIKLNNALSLHELGYKGEGKIIAVVDGGFANLDLMPEYFDTSKILGVRNFTHEKGDPYRLPEQHGTTVISCILANKMGSMIGTAPEANFYLLKTEVSKEEFPVEEDYWVAALEYADSLGVDIVSTSLGYATFDVSSMNHTHGELDGYSVYASRAASMAASKGLLLFNSAGNQGNKDWGKVTIPADAPNIITVGSINKDSIRSSFSSGGYIEKDRIKPDVMALGSSASVITSFGEIINSNGTSFATPIMAGMGACLWQSLPDLSCFDLMRLIKESSDRFLDPDPYYGYGIPDLYKAYLIGQDFSSKFIEIDFPKEDFFYIDNYNHQLRFNVNFQIDKVRIYTLEGLNVIDTTLDTTFLDISFLRKGIYILCLQTHNKQYVKKFVKP